MNLFFNLPNEIQRLIYEFDSTYHDVFREVLTDLSRYIVYRVHSEIPKYIVYDKWKNTCWKTDSLEDPLWIIYYHFPPNDFLANMMDKNELCIISNPSSFPCDNFMF